LNLDQYIEFFIRKKLSASHDAKDIKQEVYLVMLEKAQLRGYALSNAIPKGKDLSFLKAVIFRTRLKQIKKDNRFATGNRDLSLAQLLRALRDSGDPAYGALSGGEPAEAAGQETAEAGDYGSWGYDREKAVVRIMPIAPSAPSQKN
jgi:hypothetical protein